MWPKTFDYRTDGPMAALFNRGPRPGPIAPFKMQPKVVVLGRVLNAAQGLTLGHV